MIRIRVSDVVDLSSMAARRDCQFATGAMRFSTIPPALALSPGIELSCWRHATRLADLITALARRRRRRFDSLNDSACVADIGDFIVFSTQNKLLIASSSLRLQPYSFFVITVTDSCFRLANVVYTSGDSDVILFHIYAS